MNYFYVPIQSNNLRVNRDSIRRKRFFRLVLITAILLFSFIFGAMIHANAYSNGDHPIDREGVSESALVSSQQQVIQFEKTVMIEQGDTLWSIAARHVPDRLDIRSYIVDIKQMNHLDDSLIQAGQIIVIP